MTLAILADIGGTNTRVALAEGSRVRLDSIRRFPNAEYQARGQDIAHVLRDYLDQTGASKSRPKPRTARIRRPAGSILNSGVPG